MDGQAEHVELSDEVGLHGEDNAVSAPEKLFCSGRVGDLSNIRPAFAGCIR